MRDSGLTSGPVALDTRQQRFVAWLADAYEGSKWKELHDYPTTGAPICKVDKKEYEGGRTAETMG
jgi:hypothetical protein